MQRTGNCTLMQTMPIFCNEVQHLEASTKVSAIVYIYYRISIIFASAAEDCRSGVKVEPAAVIDDGAPRKRFTTPQKVSIAVAVFLVLVATILIVLSIFGVKGFPLLWHSPSKASHLATTSYIDPTRFPTEAPHKKTLKPTSRPSRPTRAPSSIAPSAEPTYTAVPTTVPSSIAPTDVSQLWTISYLRTSGSQIIDRGGNPVRIASINW